MANRIKGLNVEIDGSTTGLDKALKNVNTTIKGTQTQLKDVQKLLKLVPSNTELLSQKQRLLKEAIGATKDKLDSLKTAQEQAKKQLEEGTLGQDKYDALQREIEETEQALKQLESQVSTTYATARYNATEATAVSATTATTAELTNTYMQDTGDLELTKKIVGQGADPDKEFLFTISLTAPSGTTLADEYSFKKGGETATGITYIKSAENNKATITGIKLKGDEKFTIEGLPAGTNYIIAESDYSQDGYSASTTQGNLEGTIPGGANAKASVEVTNTHITGILTVEKTVSGTGASTADEFDFKATIVRQNNAKFYIEVTDDGINLVTRVDNTKPSEWTTKNAVYGIVKDFAVATDIANAKATIENEPGAALPNTGGPGTRIFTILGSILILGAGVLLWRRRRTINN